MASSFCSRIREQDVRVFVVLGGPLFLQASGLFR